MLVSSVYAVQEARRNLRERDQVERLEKLLANVETVPDVSLPYERAAEVDLPSKDLPILAGSVAARATHLITGDVRHFGAYFGKDLLGLTVMPPAQYLKTRA